MKRIYFDMLHKAISHVGTLNNKKVHYVGRDKKGYFITDDIISYPFVIMNPPFGIKNSNIDRITKIKILFNESRKK